MSHSFVADTDYFASHLFSVLSARLSSLAMFPLVPRATLPYAQDFYNLVDVYLDAVFHPRCVSDRRVFEQEGWHYELDNKEVREWVQEMEGKPWGKNCAEGDKERFYDIPSFSSFLDLTGSPLFP